MTRAPAPTADSIHGPDRLRSFDRSLPMGLLRAREAAMRLFRAHLAHHDLTEQRWRVLRALSAAADPTGRDDGALTLDVGDVDVGDIDVGDIAERTFLLGPSLSRILGDLEARGLVDRTVDVADQRRSLLSLTDAGRDLVAAVAPESEAIYEAIEDRFGAERLGGLLADLRDLEAALADVSPGSPATGRTTP